MTETEEQIFSLILAVFIVCFFVGAAGLIVLFTYAHFWGIAPYEAFEQLRESIR